MNAQSQSSAVVKFNMFFRRLIRLRLRRFRLERDSNSVHLAIGAPNIKYVIIRRLLVLTSIGFTLQGVSQYLMKV